MVPRTETKLCIHVSRWNFPTVTKVFKNKSGQGLEKTFWPLFVFVWFRESNEIYETRANIPKSCRRPVVSLFYATKSYRVNRPLLLRIYVGHAHLPLLSHSWQVVTWCKLIWPDLVFGFVHKRSGNEIRTAIWKFSNVRESIQQSKRMDWLLFLCWVF